MLMSLVNYAKHTGSFILGTICFGVGILALVYIGSEMGLKVNSQVATGEEILLLIGLILVGVGFTFCAAGAFVCFVAYVIQKMCVAILGVFDVEIVEPVVKQTTAADNTLLLPLYTIYLYTYKEDNNRRYVGLTKNPVERKKAHSDATATGSLFHALIRSKGFDSFQYEVLEQVNGREYAGEREKFYINQYDSYYMEGSCKGLNKTRGG